MKKNISYAVLTLFAVAAAALGTSCKVEATYHSESRPDLFFDNQQKVYQRMARPLTHWVWCVAGGERQARTGFYELNEMTADGLLTPKRYNDWYDNGKFIRYYKHDFSPAHDDAFKELWELVGMGVAQSWNAKEDIETYVDFEELQFPEGTQEAISMQLQTLVAFFYYYGLDAFGGMPLYENSGGEAKARSTDVETFEFIEKLLLDALPKLPKKAVLGGTENGTINQAAAAMILVRLYFNAEAYIRTPMYAEAAKICEDIMNGVYGPYALDDDWTDIFGFDNQTSPEIIWSAPSENAVSERNVDPHSSPYGMKEYWNNTTVGSTNNGYCLVPSLDLDSLSYVYGAPNPSPKGTYRLGSPFAKFEETDVRKQLYAYEGGKKWRGMFLFGELVNPVTGGKSMGGGRQIRGDQVAMLPDQIGRKTLMYGIVNGVPDQPLLDDHLKEGVEWAEEASGVRLAKMSPIPWESENALKGNPDIPVFRMAEVYYTLAECKLREGDKTGAADLINDVRERYFEGGNDPNPVTAANLDEWRMLDEWLIEFLGEGRRRVDLIRWGKYTTESWWDHPADGPGKEHFNRFPIPEATIAGNQLLKQNPGYSGYSGE